MKRTKTVQYTIRGIPATLDWAVRARAKKENKSVNQWTLEALQQVLGIPESKPLMNNLKKYIGTWVEDPEFDRIMAEQDQIDEEMWR